MSGAVDFHLRRVGFRTGTADELMALHAVEAPIEAERRSDRVPQPVESYIAFARKLPSQFDDHAWLVEASDGRVGCRWVLLVELRRGPSSHGV